MVKVGNRKDMYIISKLGQIFDLERKNSDHMVPWAAFFQPAQFSIFPPIAACPI